MLALGIDVGGTSTKLALWAPGRPAATARSATYSRPTHGAWRHAVLDALGTLPVEGVGAVGLCAPGLYDPSTRTVTRSVNMPAIVGIDLPDLARALAPDARRVLVTSDARAAAHDVFVGESLSGRLLALSLGTGVGAAVLDDAKPLHVSANSPGHFGQIDVGIAEPGRPTPIGPDGGRGGLEAYVGLPALRERYPGSPDAWRDALTPLSPPVQALVRALRIAHALYRPDHVRLLGGVGVCLKPMTSPILHQVADHLTSLARPGWSFGVATSDFHAAIGAARLAFASDST